MLIEQTLEKLTAMKLGAMAEAVQQQLGSDEATALSFEDRLGVLGLPRVVAAPMAGQLGLAVQEPDGGRAGHEREGAPHVRVGNRVLIPIEADVGRLAGAHRAQDVGLKRVRRQAVVLAWRRRVPARRRGASPGSARYATSLPPGSTVRPRPAPAWPTDRGAARPRARFRGPGVGRTVWGSRLVEWPYAPESRHPAYPGRSRDQNF